MINYYIQPVQLVDESCGDQGSFTPDGRILRYGYQIIDSDALKFALLIKEHRQS